MKNQTHIIQSLPALLILALAAPPATAEPVRTATEGYVDRRIAAATNGLTTVESDPVFTAWKTGPYTSIGPGAYASHMLSVAIGAGTQSRGEYTINIGNEYTTTLDRVYFGSQSLKSILDGYALAGHSHSGYATTLHEHSEYATWQGLEAERDRIDALEEVIEDIDLSEPAFTDWKNFGSIAAGYKAEAKTLAVALGSLAGAANNSIAIGSGAVTHRDRSIAVGNNASADFRSIAVGYGATASNQNAVAVGYEANASNIYSTVIGDYAHSHGDFTVNLGMDDIDPSNVYIGARSLQSHLDEQTTTITSNLTGQIERVYTFVSGDGVWFSVTNYNRQTGTVPTMALYEIRDGETNCVWSQSEGMGQTLTNANTYTDTEITALRGDMPDKAWSLYTSGLGLPAPSNTTWISTPETVIAGGLEYQKTVGASGSYWFLISNGMTAQIANTNGYLSIVDDNGDTGFTIRKSNAYTVGAAIDGITVTQVDGYDHVRLTFPVVSAAPPTIYASPTLRPAAWTADLPATVSWSGGSGAWIADIDMTVQCDQHFFKAEVFVEGESIIEMNKPLSSAAGILCTDGIHKCRPVWNSNNTITWEVVQ